jgi:hypothetical protein
MQNNTANLSRLVLVTLTSALLFLSGCTLTNSISHGNLENGVYHSSTNAFSFPLRAEAIVHDGLHPLGGWVSIRNLPDPTVEKGLSYNRIALPEHEISLEKIQAIIKSGHDFWLSANTSRDLKHIIYDKWIEADGGPFYFSIIEGPDEGLVVKPGGYYGTLSFMRGNYSYVLSEYIEAPYQLKGKEDSEERTRVKNSNIRLKSINDYFNKMKFEISDKPEFPLK